MQSVVDAHHRHSEQASAEASHREREWRESIAQLHEQLKGLQVSRVDMSLARDWLSISYRPKRKKSTHALALNTIYSANSATSSLLSSQSTRKHAIS